jgi:hypothetical protein
MPPVLREPFRRRPIRSFPSSEHSAAGSLHATADALDLALGNR